MRNTANPSLTDGQIICLRLVGSNLTSKEIAARLGISPHTVDQRVRKALRVLGSSNRRDAARLVRSRPYWQPGNAATPVREAVQTRANAAPIENKSVAPLALPFATAARPTNTMRAGMRMVWIAAIAAAAFASGSIYLAGLESLARLLRH